MKQAKAYLPISIITAFALFLRLWRLNQPKGYIFDEVYYAKNANSLINHGVELSSTNQAEFIVHPPLGKWLIGLGIKFFGNSNSQIIGMIRFLILVNFLSTKKSRSCFVLTKLLS